MTTIDERWHCHRDLPSPHQRAVTMATANASTEGAPWPIATAETLSQLRYGRCLARDYRATGPREHAEDGHARRLRVVDWNIERGKRLVAVVAELRRLDADVLLLQEVDIGVARSGGVDVAHALGSALALNTLVAVEMEIIAGGVMCNAILTKHDFVDVVAHDPTGGGAGVEGGGLEGDAPLGGAFVHPTQVVDYFTLGPQCRWWGRFFGIGVTPRVGGRVAARATIATPLGSALFYSDHLEMFCGPRGRMAQIDDLLRDAEAWRGRVPQQVIAGDLNTTAKGFLNWHPRHRDDVTEALAGVAEESLLLDGVLGDADSRAAFAHVPNLARNTEPPFVNCGGRESTASEFGLDWKLDYVLARGLRCLGGEIGNADLSASDHKAVVVDFAAS